MAALYTGILVDENNRLAQYPDLCGGLLYSGIEESEWNFVICTVISADPRWKTPVYSTQQVPRTNEIQDNPGCDQQIPVGRPQVVAILSSSLTAWIILGFSLALVGGGWWVSQGYVRAPWNWPALAIASAGIILSFAIFAILRTLSNEQRRLVESAAEIAAKAQVSHQRLELVTRGSNDGIWDWDVVAARVHFSPRWKEMIGYRDDEIAQSPDEWDTRLHPDDRERAVAYQRAYLDGTTDSYSQEFRLRHKDGSYVWILSRGVALHDADGKLRRVVGSHTDITERKEGEQKIRELNSSLAELNEALWRTLGGPASDAEAIDSERSHLERLNDPARLEALAKTNLMDTPVEEKFDRFTRLGAKSLSVPVCILSLVDGERQFFKSGLGLPPPYDVKRETPLSHSFCQYVVTSGQPLSISDARTNPLVCENLAVRDLGVIAYLGTPLTTPQGKTLGSFCAIDTRPREWTEQDRAHLEGIARSLMTEIAVQSRIAELRHSQERFELAALGAVDGIWDWDIATGHVYYSPRWAEMRGCSPEDISNFGTDWSDRIHPDDKDRVLSALKAHEIGKTSLFCEEYRTLCKDGTWKWVQDRGIARRDANGKAVRMAGSETDISERKRIEAQIKNSLEEKEVLLKEVHHRVKNNLQIVSSLLNLQSRQFADPLLVAAFSSTRERVRAMAAVHERLYETGDFSVVQLDEQILALVRILTVAHIHESVRLRCVPNLEPVRVDLNTAIPLSLIVNELILNAAKYAYQGRTEGELRIDLRAGPECNELIISDDGPGLPQSVEPSSTKSLGLRIVRDLARQIRADVKVESSATGTAFTIAWKAGATNDETY